MPPREQQRDRVLARLADHLLATGLSRASLRELARAGGVSDRMLLYYFADKAEVLAAACAQVSANSAGRIAAAFPPGTRLSAPALTREAVRLTTSAEMRPFMRLWVEIVAAAARREEPFPAVAATILDGFLGWIRLHLAEDPGADPEAQAAIILATIDGLALIDVCRGDGLVERAAALL